jgi:excinuclease ABC subunit B
MNFLRESHEIVFVSATPGVFEQRMSGHVVEQIIRPTGLVDPEIDVRPTVNQIDDLIGEIAARAARHERALVTTLTKKMAENLTEYLTEAGLRARYLHSEIDTLDRIRIVRELRLGLFDVLVGVNLLREGLDLPEVTLVAILDADKEGFLRGTTSLIQTIGRAARNVDGRVIMYADKHTDSMTTAINETNRRRDIQIAYNTAHGVTPRSVVKGVSDIVALLGLGEHPAVKSRGKDAREAAATASARTLEEIDTLLVELESDMLIAADELRFEQAARLRDQIADLQVERDARDPGSASSRGTAGITTGG